MPLDEQQFNQILDRVTTSAPKGLSEDQFNHLLDAEVMKASGSQPNKSALSPSHAKPNEAPGIIAEGLGTFKRIGNAIGSFTAPGRYYDDAGGLMPKQFDAQGKPVQPEGSREMGDYVAAHPIREGLNVALPIAAETMAIPAWQGVGNTLKNHGPLIRKASKGGVLGVVGRYAENIGEWMSPSAKAATAAKAVKGARLSPASDAEIAATIEQELNARLSGGPAPVASHTPTPTPTPKAWNPPRTMDRAREMAAETRGSLEDVVGGKSPEDAATALRVEAFRKGHGTYDASSAINEDVLQRMYDEAVRLNGGKPTTASAGTVHVPAGAEITPSELRPRTIEEAQAAYLADREAVGPRAHETTEYMRPPAQTGGVLKPKPVPSIVQEIDSALARLKAGESTGAPAPAALASHPAGGRVTTPPTPNSYTATRTPASAVQFNKPRFEQGPPAPKNSAKASAVPTAPGIVKPPVKAKAPMQKAEVPTQAQEALSNSRGLTAAATERLMNVHTPGWKNVSLENLGVSPTVPGIVAAPEPPPVLRASKSRSVRGVRAAQTVGITQNDVTELAKQLGITPEEVVMKLKATEMARAERHIGKLYENNAKAETVAGQLDMYRKTFGPEFGKNIHSPKK